MRCNCDFGLYAQDVASASQFQSRAISWHLGFFIDLRPIVLDMDQGSPVTNPEPFWLFMHIPKAAGTTLRSIVDAQYGADAVLTYYNQRNRQLLDNLPYVLMDERRSYRALIGHFSFGVHEGLPRLARYVTFLRDPVTRAVSAYFENIKTHPRRLTRPDGKLMSLREALDRLGGQLENHLIKAVTGLPNDAVVTDSDLAHAQDNIAQHLNFWARRSDSPSPCCC
jgi:hypothetical protein